MRVLLVTPSVSNIGGVDIYTKNLSSGLVLSGVDVKILSSETVPIIPIQGLKNASFALSGTLAGLINRGDRFDIVHAQNLPSLLPAKAHTARAMVLTLHGIYSEQIQMLHGRTIGDLVFWVENRLMRSVNVITAVSRQVAEYYRTLGFEIEYIPNGIDMKGLPTHALRYYPLQIVVVGRLSREKGVDILIRAFKEVPAEKKARLLIVGAGPEEGYLKGLASADPRIEFLGAKEHDTALQIINGSDIFVLPSRMEGLPMAIIEAMALKKPVIASAVGGITELVEDGKTGLLFKSEDVNGLRLAIEKLIDDGSLAKALSANGLDKVKKEYSIERMISRYLDLYRRLLR